MHIWWEIEYVRASDGQSVHSDICQDPHKSTDPISTETLLKEIMERADLTQPWRLESHGYCKVHSK